MRNSLLAILLLIGFTTCKNLEDAEPSARKSFIKIFENAYSMTAVSMDIVPDGYVILGNNFVSTADTSFTQTIIFKTDKKGNRISDFVTFPGAIAKSFTRINNSNFNGYVIVGDSVKIDPFEEDAANVSIASIRIHSINDSFETSDKAYVTDISGALIKEDYIGGAIVSVNPEKVIVVATYKEGVVGQLIAPEKQLLLSYTVGTDGSLTRDWINGIDLLGQGYLYKNSRTVHYDNGKIIWASAIAFTQGNFNTSYVGIPVVPEQAIPDNFSLIGSTSSQSFVPKDIQSAKFSGFGYGVIGTYSQTLDGSKGNIFFLRVDKNGNIIPGSDRYFDGIESSSGESIDKNTSSIIDEGEALTATSDGGFVLAGYIQSTPQKGSGGKDIYLIKIDLSGNILWTKTLGASGDEEITTIKETEDGDLIICGTNTTGNYSSIFLMKTDSNGEVKN